MGWVLKKIIINSPLLLLSKFFHCSPADAFGWLQCHWTIWHSDI